MNANTVNVATFRHAHYCSGFSKLRGPHTLALIGGLETILCIFVRVKRKVKIISYVGRYRYKNKLCINVISMTSFIT